MKKVSMIITAVICFGVAGLLRADDWEPQNAGTQKVNNKRKAGGENLTLHDQSQINGNLNGDGRSVNGDDKFGGSLKKAHSFDKHASLKKAGITDGTSKIEHGGAGGHGQGKVSVHDISLGGNGNKGVVIQGGLKKSGAGNGLVKNGSNKGVLIGLNKAGGLQKANGLQKVNGLAKVNGLQKANGLNKAGAGPGGGPGISGGMGESSSR